MPFTKKEQKQFEQIVRDELMPGKSETRKNFIKRTADFLFELPGNVNWRMAVFNRFE